MKQYQAKHVETAITQGLKERGIKLWWAGTSPQSTQAQLPAFVDLFKEMFDACYDGDNGMNNMIDKKVRPLFEKLVSSAQREAGHADVFALPKMVNLEPAVWDHLERLITANPVITKCRSCGKKFDAKRGELLAIIEANRLGRGERFE